MRRAPLTVTTFLFPLLFSASAMVGTREVEEVVTAALPLLFHGRLVDDGGKPIPNAYVQFWQTDTSGIYDHPEFDVGFDAAGDSTDLDPSFQYFGTASTDADGAFFFKTHRPGIYSARPVTHIHYKVWDGDGPTLLLTSQFYFKDEDTRYSPLLQLELSDVMDDEGGSTVVATRTNKTIAVNMGGGGSEPLSPRQQEGPYYPVVDFFGYDNDLTNAASGVSSTSAAPTGTGTGKLDKMSGGGVGMVVSVLSLAVLWL